MFPGGRGESKRAAGVENFRGRRWVLGENGSVAKIGFAAWFEGAAAQRANNAVGFFNFAVLTLSSNMAGELGLEQFRQWQACWGEGPHGKRSRYSGQ